MNFTKTLAVGTFLATALVAGSAFAKAHDQGKDSRFSGDNFEGADARQETADFASTTLGPALQQARGFARFGEPGKSDPSGTPGDTEEGETGE